MANEIRLRSNNSSGAITDNPLTNVATTINSPGMVDLPVVDATNHLLLILDPLELNGPAEIVRVTAHTNAASSVTVVRAAEGSAARTHAIGTTWFHGPVVSDYNFTDIGALSTNRPAAPTVGQLIYETDTNSYVGRAAGPVWQTVVPLGAWTSYTPTLTNLTLGNGTSVATFARIGRTIHWRWVFTLGTTSAVGTVPTISLPVAAAADYSGQGPTFGICTFIDQGVANYSGRVTGLSSTTVHFQNENAAGTSVVMTNTSATVPFTFGSTDQIFATGTYEAAS